MKKLVSILLVCVMLASVLVSEAAAQSAEGVVTPAKVDGQNLHKQVSFEIGLKQLKISKIDDFDWVDLPKCSRISALGHPALPIKSIVVKLPRNTKVIGVNPTETTSITVPDKYRIAPALQPHPISGPRKGKLSESLREIYESKVPYPEKLFDVYNSKGRDYNYVIIYTYPLRWTPAEGKLELTTKATFDVEYTTEAGSSATGEVQPLQVNPEEIIITAPAYETAANTLAEWRTSNGIETAVINTTWIYDNYGGVDNPQKIRNFIRYMFDTYNINYVLLFGDAEDVPPRYAYIPDSYYDDSSPDGILVPTDYYYECLDDTWDANGDKNYADLNNDWTWDEDGVTKCIDFMPDVSAGRLSVNDAATASQVVTKIIQYEQNIDPTWFKKMVLVGTDTFGGAEGEILKDYIQDIVDDNFTDFVKLYETKGTLSASAISTNINSGSGAINFAGHGGYGSWSLGSFRYYTNNNVASLTNSNKLPILCTMSCLTGGFDSVYNTGNCIGEEFLRNPNGGGIAYVGATRVAWGYGGTYITWGLAGELDWQFWQSYNRGITKPGDMLTEAKINYITNHPLNTSYEGYGYLDEKTILEYVLLGDPVIVIPPISVTVDAPAIVEINDIFDVTATISNSGTETVTEVNATTSWIPESGLRTTDALTKPVGDITGGGSKIVSWTMNADAIGIYNLTVDASATNAEPVNDTTTIEVTPPITLEFQDSFEDGLGKWVQDPQNDWFVSTQRATDGSHSVEVDGWATDATLTPSNAINLAEKTSATLTFSWLIESSWDAGEYICLDMYYDGVWHNGVPGTASCLEGNVDAENIWHDESIDLSDYMTSDFKIRFRAKVSSSREDGNVDNVKIISYAKPPTPDTTPPAVMLVNPEDGATDTDGNVTFEYIPDDADSGIASCELIIINGNSDKKDTSIEEGVTNSFTKTGMTNGTYTWNVKCIDDSPNANEGSGIVRTLYINIDTEAPEITSITGDTSTTTGDPVDIVVTAADNIDPTSAKIFIDGDATGIGMVEDPGDTFTYTYTYTAPTDNVASHTYYVEVYDAAENSARAPKEETETYTITVTDNDAPSTITDLRATAVAGGKINLSWSAATDNIGMVSYKVYRDTTKITNLTGLTPIKTGVTDTSYTDDAAVDGTTYWYAVAGVDDAGNEGEVSNSPSATADATAPTISTVAASSITDSSATITWTTDEASDSVVRYGTTTSPTSEASDATMVTSHSVTLTGLTAGTEYYYEVESTDAAGNTAIDNNDGAYYTFTTTAPSATAYVSIEMSKQSIWKWWRVTAAVTITENDASGPPIEGVTLEGYWSDAYSGTESGMTDKNGKVSFRTGWITESGEVCFTVDRVVGYDLAGETTKCTNGGSSGGWRSRS